MVKEIHLQQNRLATLFCLLCHVSTQVRTATVHLRVSHVRTATSGVAVLREVAWTRWTNVAAHRYLPQCLAACSCGHRCLITVVRCPDAGRQQAVRAGNAFLCVPGRVEASPSPGQGQGCGCLSLITCPSPVVEGGSSLQGASASRSTPGCASVQPGPASAHSHRGIAGPRGCGSPPTRGSWPGRAATACSPAARRARSSGVGCAWRCGRAPTQRGSPRRAGEVASCRQPPCPGPV